MHKGERHYTAVKLDERAPICSPIFRTFDQHGATSDLSIERVLAGHWPELFVNWAPSQSLCENLDQTYPHHTRRSDSSHLGTHTAQ